MSSKAGEISSIIKEQIKQYESKIEMKENGTVITVGDGIATVYGCAPAWPTSCSGLRTGASAWRRIWRRRRCPSPS